VASTAGTTDALTSSLNVAATWNLGAGTFADVTDARSLTFANVETLNGGPGTDTVIGANVANTWNITGANAGNVGGIAFTAMENLTGGTNTDNFIIAASGSIANLDGAAGNDTVDYSAKSAQTVALTALGGADGFNGTITGGFLTGSFSNINTVTGNSGAGD